MVNSAAKSQRTPIPGPAHAECSYRFLDFTLDLATERLVGVAGEIKLRPKSFLVLRYLVEHRGRLVTRAELMQAVWEDVAVTDEAITKCIADIRRALADYSQNIIRTVTRRGFLFEAEVHVIPPPQASEGQSPPRLTPPGKNLISRPRLSLAIIIAGITVCVVATLIAWLQRPKSLHTFQAIAVLPFESFATDVDQHLLADGMTEALITDLGRRAPYA